MRSVVVVFPASMWAMMPMFLQRSNGTVLGTVFLCSSWGSEILSLVVSRSLQESFASSSQPEARSCPLPPVMRERLVRFRHAMHVFLFLDGSALAVRGVEQFVRQFLDHSLFAAAARIAHDPADRQRRPPVRTDFDRHLVVRTAHPPSLYLQQRLGVLHRLREQLQGLVAAFFLQLLQRLIKNALGSRLLSLPHHRVDELRHQIRSIHGIRLDRPLWGMSFSWHSASSSWLLASS